MIWGDNLKSISWDTELILISRSFQAWVCVHKHTQLSDSTTTATTSTHTPPNPVSQKSCPNHETMNVMIEPGNHPPWIPLKWARDLNRHFPRVAVHTVYGRTDHSSRCRDHCPPVGRRDEPAWVENIWDNFQQRRTNIPWPPSGSQPSHLPQLLHSPNIYKVF